MTDPQLLTFNNWTYRLRMPPGNPERLLVLIHGWMGDENSMWVLAHNLPPEIAILAPRAPIVVPEGGYSWRKIKPGTWENAAVEDFHPAADSLLAFVEDWAASTGVDGNKIELMGFSQGAAMSYVLASLYPQRIRQFAALSGFIPQGGEALLAAHRLSGKPVFVSHGRQDDMIPLEQAHKAVAQLELAGAQVTYCESDAGHKVSKECLKAMELFFGKS